MLKMVQDAHSSGGKMFGGVALEVIRKSKWPVLESVRYLSGHCPEKIGKELSAEPLSFIFE